MMLVKTRRVILTAIFNYYILCVKCQDLGDAESEVFGVASDDTIVQQAYQDSFGQKHYNLHVFGEDWTLVLRPNHQLFTENSDVITRHNGHVVSRDKLAGRGYHNGFVHSHPGSTVAIRVRDGALSGVIVTVDHYMTIDALKDNLHNATNGSVPFNHVVTRRSHGKDDLEKILPVLKTTKTHTITKRSVDDNTRYLEGMLVAHSSTVSFHGDFIDDFLVLVADLINILYRDDSIGEVKVVYVLARALKVTGNELDSAANNIDDSSKLITFFKNWVNTLQNNDEESDDHFDHASLITKKICGTQSCGINGRGYYNGMCGTLSVTTSVDRGVGTAAILAHEIGHNFNLGHDSGECAQGYIMSSGLHESVNSYRWSSCSRTKIQSYLADRERFSCLNDLPKALKSKAFVDSSAWGRNISRDKQCQMMFGEDYGQCGPFMSSCSLLYCRKSGSSVCAHHGIAPVEGSECGLYKWCQSGYCVHEPIPDPIDGNWGAWSEFKPCTRTCGVGVRLRERTCDNPRPQYYGKDCVGDKLGHFEVCNTDDCPPQTPSFRYQQCKDKGYEKDYGEGCSLNCQNGSFIYYVRIPVIDGTRCTNNPYDYDVCVQGVCKTVGCDIKFSSFVNDRCGICNGSGNTCELVTGTLDGDLSTIRKDEYKFLFVLPAGYSNLDMKELKTSYNDIIVQKGNGDNLYEPITFSSVKYYAGTKVSYVRESSSYPDELTITGRLTEPVKIMAYKNYGSTMLVEYKYYKPISEPSDISNLKFYWKRSETTCSRLCGTGSKTIFGQCHRSDDNTTVNNIHCDASSDPHGTEVCNTEPCEPDWVKGLWSRCNTTCGPYGNRVRDVQCRQRYSSTFHKVLEDSNCNKTKPDDIESCNRIDCQPDWVPGPWSECSRKKCRGVRSRDLYCRKLLVSGEILHLTDAECVTARPVDQIVCNNDINCYEWLAMYPDCTACKEDSSSIVSHTPVGCYNFEEKLLGSPLGTVDVDPLNSMKAVDNCALLAWEYARRMFAVGANGQCYGSMDGHEKYHYGGRSLQCKENVGANSSVFVYGINSKVLVSNQTCIYKENNSIIANSFCDDPEPNPVMKLCCEEVCASFCFETDSGGYCTIPFVYKGKEYRECLRDEENKLWCSKTSNYDIDGEKEYCKEPCRQKTIHGNCCSFPFIYRGRLRNSCVQCDNCDEPWCGLTSNYDRDQKGEPCALESG